MGSWRKVSFDNLEKQGIEPATLTVRLLKIFSCSTDHELILLINVKMPTIVGILTLIN